MRDLAASGFVREAKPYIKNKLDLLVTQGNPHGIGDGVMPAGVTPTGDADTDKIVDIVFDLLDPGVPVSQVDHINEGIHNAINNMYRLMDQYIRDNGTTSQVAELDARLAAVADPQTGSPADTRTGISINFDLATNDACNYGNGTLRFCEFAVLNKANTHETRVHHVETPERVRSGESGTGPLWITEVTYARNSGNPVPVEGVDIAAADPAEAVNPPVSYSIALLSTAKHKRLGNAFIDWIRSPDGQRVYTGAASSVCRTRNSPAVNAIPSTARPVMWPLLHGKTSAADEPDNSLTGLAAVRAPARAAAGPRTPSPAST